jgi:hypothetical protein
MRTNEEIRNEAWTKLWHEKWFWRILIASILLDLSMQLIIKIIYFVANTCIGDLGTLSQTNLSNSLAMIVRGDMSALPTITLHIAITAFLTMIATGITQFGKSTVLLRAADGKQEGYLKAAFEGLKMPLGLAYLTLRVTLVFILWGILAILPCIGGAAICELIAIDETFIKIAAWALIITTAATFSLAIIAIPFYRYRFLFRLKADNSEWSASKCMKECRSLTDGRKWRIFKHDCSYWKILLLPLIIGSTLSAIMLICLYKMKINFYAQNLATPESMVICLSVIGLYIAFIAVTIISAIYISLGQTILYRDMLSENTKDTDNTDE